MKKILISILLVFAATFVLVGGVDAALDCDLNGKAVTIKKEGVKPDGFEVKVPYCQYGKDPVGYGPMGKFYDSYDSAYNHGTDTTVKQFEDADGKGVHLGTVYVCNSPLRKVNGTYKCTATVSATETKHAAKTCSGTTKATCEAVSNCTFTEATKDADGNDVPASCSGDGEKAYKTYKCPDGYSPTDETRSSHSCTKEWTTEVQDIDKSKTADDAKSACESETKATCSSCSIKYQLYCPIYKCNLNFKTINACNQTFSIDGNPAYCVNPSQKFNVAENGNPNYVVDDAFDVDACASSYSTVDCGYANILIEGAYYNKPKEGHSIPDSAINLALRLWGAHTGQAGFDKTGLAFLTGDNCTDPIYYEKYDGKHYANVYKFTHDYIMAHFYSIAVKYDHIPADEKYMTGYDGDTTRGKTFEKIACDRTNTRNLLGVACGDNTSYRIAFELYFNTLIGNKHMKDHLLSLVGGENGAKPTGATIKTDDSESTWVEVSFAQELNWEEIKDEEIDCKQLDKMVSEGKITAAQRDQIKQYCKVRVEIYDEDGKLVVDDLGMDKCYKGSGCRTKRFEFAVCDIIKKTGKQLEIRVTYKKTESNFTIRKYQSCSNANVNQVMFAYIELFDGEEVSKHTSKIEEIGREEITSSFAVTNYKCEGGCEDATIRVDGMRNACSSDKNDYEYGKVYTSTIKDPSLSCVVNLKDPQQKNQYDYSDYFGVNTNFCRIYCSDEVEYHIADKVHAISGRTFKYDIEFNSYGTKNSSMLLSSSVEVKRTCTSEIFYDNLPKTVDWKTMYGLDDTEAKSLKNNSTFANLFNILKAKASKENNRFENLNQIVYDLYNCNFYAKDTIAANNITQPKENTIGNMRDRVKGIYKAENGYGLDTDSKGKSTWMSSMPGVSSAAASAQAQYKGRTYVYYDYAAIEEGTGKTISPVTNRVAKFEGGMSSITYCTDKNGSACFAYTGAAHDKESYNYKTGTTTSAETTYTFNGKNIKVPTNDYATFSVTTRADFANGTVYQAADNTSGTVIKGGSNESLITLERYTYPIDKTAYNNSACNKNGISVANPNSPNDKRCEMHQVINPVLFYRNQTNDNLTKLVTQKNKFTCYVDVEMPQPSQTSTVYRNVDPSNLFPSTNGEPKAGSNWDTPEGREAAEQIQNSASELTTTTNLLEYKITLTPTQIKNIKNYNSKNGVYSNEVVYNCTKVDNTYYINCKSGFMDILRGTNSLYSAGTYGTLDSNFSGK